MQLLSKLLGGRRVADTYPPGLLSRYVAICLEEPEYEISYYLSGDIGSEEG